MPATITCQDGDEKTCTFCVPPTPTNQRDAEEQDDSITVQTVATTNNIKRKIDDVHGGGTEMDDDVDSSSPTPNQHSYAGSLSAWHFDIDVAKKQLENAGAMLELAKAHMQLAQKHYAEAEQFLGDTYKRKKKELYAAGRKKRARKAALSGATKIVG